MIRIAVVVPCYNERARMKPEVWLEFLADPDNADIHFFFANDGSTDATPRVLEDLCGKSDSARLFDFAVRRGKAETIRRSALKVLAEATEAGKPFDYLGFWDADLATPLDEIRDIRNLVREYPFDGVFCSRIKRLGAIIERKPLRHVLGRAFATAASLMLNLPVYDTQCGAKMFRSQTLRQVMEEPFVSDWIFDLELIFRMKQCGFDRLYEKPVASWSDVPGSKIKLIDVLRIPVELLKIRRRYR